MAKLNQLLTLESMLKQYDGLNIENPQDIYMRGQLVMEQVDCIIAKLTRLVESKTRLSGRNVLTANFSTMIETSHWLNSKLLKDLPRADSRNMRNKIYEMVDLMLRLMAKITDVDGEYAERFFERLKKRCYNYSVTKYDLWKKQQPVLTIKEYVEYQVELTAKLLDKGLLKYIEDPSGEDIEGVNVRMLLLRLKDRKEITEVFKAEAAKLRKISYWDGDMFMIRYEWLRDYIFRNLSRFSFDLLISLFEYDVEMKQVRADIKRYMEEQKATKKDDDDYFMEKLDAALNEVETYMWGQSAHAVLFCALRDNHGFTDNMSRYERIHKKLCEKRKLQWACPEGTIRSAFRDNSYFKNPVNRWKTLNVPQRVMTLYDKFEEFYD
jgi:hypothetical protein